MGGLNDQLNINTSMLGPNQPLLVVSGEIEFGTAPMLRTAIDASLDATAGAITIDLAAVSFIDSSGLAVLVDAHTRATVVLRHPSPAVERVIAVTGLSSTLQIESA